MGEQVSIGFYPPLSMTFPEDPWWSVSGGGLNPMTGEATTFTAASNAASATVTVFVRDVQLEKKFNALEPTLHGNSEIIATNHFPIGEVAAGMNG